MEKTVRKHTAETKAKIRAYQLGRKKSPSSIAKMILGKTKNWEDCGYMGKHRRIWKKFGKANKCENPSCPKKCLYYEWANISGKYKEDRDDWKMMCCQCHKRWDVEKGFNEVEDYYVHKNN